MTKRNRRRPNILLGHLGSPCHSFSIAYQCEWTREIFRELAKDGRDFDNTVVIVCGNKSDDAAAKKRQVDDIEARLWAELR